MPRTHTAPGVLTWVQFPPTDLHSLLYCARPGALPCSPAGPAPGAAVHNPEKPGRALSAHTCASLNEERANPGWPKPKRDSPLCSWQLSFPSFESFKATAQAKIKVKGSSNQCPSPSDKRSCLQGYLPANTERRKLTLQRKREEYFGFIEQYYDSRNEEHHQDTYRQVRHHLLPFCPLVIILRCGSWKVLSGYRFAKSSGCSG